MKLARCYLIIQSVVCVLLALLLIAAVIGVYRDGLAARESDPLAPIFSREIAAQALRPIAPLFFAGVALAALGLIPGLRDENALGSAKGDRMKSKAPGGKAEALRWALLIAAIVLIAAGIFNGSAGDVFTKAIRICTECVGLG